MSYTGIIFIDLKKVLDNINHDVLLKKMVPLGFSNQTIMWFQSYLSDKNFRVNIKKKIFFSSTAEMWSTSRICLRTFAVSFIREQYETGCKL